MAAALSPSLVAVIFTTVTIAFTWAVIVWFVHAPPSTWAVFLHKRHEGYVVLESAEAGGEARRCTSALEAVRGNGMGTGRQGACGRRAPRAVIQDGCTSPLNPFLEPPDLRTGRLRARRCSADWAMEHRLFFAGVDAAPRSAGIEMKGSDDCELEALEAQIGMPGPSMDVGGVQMGWMDRGLKIVDGAVDGFVGRIVRWTDDDDGGDEALLLPIVKDV